MKVSTTEGLIEHDALDVRDIVTWGDNCRVIATEWRYHGQLVRRDVWVSGLKAPEIGVVHGE